MARLPRLSGKELVRFLGSRGFSVIRQRGSHYFLSDGEQRTCVPVHAGRVLKIGTLRAVLRDIDMSPTEFIELYSNE